MNFTQLGNQNYKHVGCGEARTALIAKDTILFVQRILRGLSRVLVMAMSICAFIFSPTSNASQQLQICDEILKVLHLQQVGHAPKDLEIDYKEVGGGDDLYPHLDIDNDGIDDSIVRSCGASLDAMCYLFVDLSSGNTLELEEERFFLAHVKSSIYVIVGEGLSESEKVKRGKRRVYEVTKQAIKLICPHV